MNNEVKSKFLYCNTENKNCVIKAKLSPTSFIKNLSNELPINPKKNSKVSDNCFVVPKLHEYDNIVKYNYRVSQLKTICKAYSQKISGNKSELQVRLYNYLRLSSNAVKIQRLIKRFYLKLYNNLKGPAKFKRDLCINDTDFFTMDAIKDIPYTYFVSIVEDNNIYGFDINSLHALFCKNKVVKNPYNRKELPDNIMTIVKKLLIYSKIVGDEIVLDKIEEELTPLQRIDMRTLQIFQKMDMLGHYTDIIWFKSLDKPKLIQFIRHISDIWYFRAQLPHHTKQHICPPSGNPFQSVPIGYQYNIITYSITSLKRISLTIMEKMILYGITDDDKYLGSSLVLCALTLVNNEAAEALPALFESVSEPPEP